VAAVDCLPRLRRPVGARCICCRKREPTLGSPGVGSASSLWFVRSHTYTHSYSKACRQDHHSSWDDSMRGQTSNNADSDISASSTLVCEARITQCSGALAACRNSEAGLSRGRLSLLHMYICTYIYSCAALAGDKSTDYLASLFTHYCRPSF
jgi:hypothetical protein